MSFSKCHQYNAQKQDNQIQELLKQELTRHGNATVYFSKQYVPLLLSKFYQPAEILQKFTQMRKDYLLELFKYFVKEGTELLTDFSNSYKDCKSVDTVVIINQLHELQYLVCWIDVFIGAAHILKQIIQPQMHIIQTFKKQFSYNKSDILQEDDRIQQKLHEILPNILRII